MAKKRETQKNIYIKGKGPRLGGPEPPLARAPRSVQDPAGAIYIGGGHFYRGRGHRAGDAPGEDGTGAAVASPWAVKAHGAPKGAPEKTQASEGGPRYPGSDPRGCQEILE